MNTGFDAREDQDFW